MSETNGYPLSPAAVAIPLLSLSAALLDSSPLVWHIRNKNFAASCLVAWIILTNFMNFINALIWPTDDLPSWYHGMILCDIEVKLMVATWTGVVGSLLCIVRNLGHVLNTKKTVLCPSRAQRQKQIVIEGFLCLFVPCWMMIAHYIVQPNRYYIFAISGCTPSVDNSWPKLALIFIWPPMICLFVVYYCMLIMYRMHKYRKEFSSILVSSQSRLTKNRFLRLYLMATTLIVTVIPVQIYILYQNSIVPMLPYSWSLVHGSDWSAIQLFPTGGVVVFDRWIQIAFGFAIFFFFGLGHDAQTMYRKWLLFIGFGRVFPSLQHSQQASRTFSQASASQSGSMNSRTRLLFKKAVKQSTLPIHEKQSLTSHGSSFMSPPSDTCTLSHVSPVVEYHGRFSRSTASDSIPFAGIAQSPEDPAAVHKPTSFMHNFLVNAHLTAPNRQMAAGLGLYGVHVQPASNSESGRAYANQWEAPA